MQYLLFIIVQRDTAGIQSNKGTWDLMITDI